MKSALVVLRAAGNDHLPVVGIGGDMRIERGEFHGNRVGRLHVVVPIKEDVRGATGNLGAVVGNNHGVSACGDDVGIKADVAQFLRDQSAVARQLSL